MGEGCVKLAVVDLDGTLIYGNSLHVFIREGFYVMLRRCKIMPCLKIIVLSLCRIIRLCSHYTFKYGCVLAIEETEELKLRFLKEIKRLERGSVVTLINEYRARGVRVLLATAAWEGYVKWIWSDDYVASTLNLEQSGHTKAQSVMDYAEKEQLCVYTIVTDHYADLPMLSMSAEEKVLVAPSMETIKRVSNAGIKFSILW